MAASVFLSYSRSDQRLALAVVDVLSRKGVEVWIDQRSIPVSVPWRDEISKGIRSAPVFAYLDTATWGRSTNCQSERAEAESLGKSLVQLCPDHAPEALATQVTTRLEALDVEAWAQATLLGDSARWVQAGRPRSTLPRGAHLRRFRPIRLAGLADEAARSYLASARSAARRRGALRTGAVALLLALFVGFQVTSRLGDAIQRTYNEQLAQNVAGRDAALLLAVDPYAGLRSAIAARQARASFLTDTAVSAALDENLPVRIVNPNASAPRQASALPASDLVLDTKRVARYGADGRVVLSSGKERTVAVALTGALTAWSWSQDGTLIALADARGVHVVRADNGVELDVLRGLDGSVDALEWTSSGVVGRAGGIEAEWPRPKLKILSHDQSWFMALAADASRTHFLGVSRTGSVSLISDDSVRVVPLAGYTLAMNAAWVNGQWAVEAVDPQDSNALLILDADGVVQRTFALPSACLPRNINAANGDQVLVGCALDRSLLIISTIDGSRRSIQLDAYPDAGLIDEDGAVIVTSVDGEVFRVPPGSQTPVLAGQWITGCNYGKSILISNGKGRILETGTGVGGGCTRIRNDPADRTVAHSIFNQTQYSGLAWARAAAWDPQGRVVTLGFASGHVWFFDADTYYTRSTTIPTGSEVRGVQFSADGNTLFFVTRDGEVGALDVTLEMASEAARVAEAERRLAIGVAGHLTAG